MERKEYPHDKMEGVDMDIEISLKEYGLAWIETDKDILFYYGIDRNEKTTDYNRFDFCSFEKDIDIKNEFDWVDFKAVASFTGVDDYKGKIHLANIVFDLLCYYGYENVFGSSYWEGLT